MLVGVSTVLILGGCSADSTEGLAPSPAAATAGASGASGGGEAAPEPAPTPTAVPSSSTVAPVPAATAPVAPPPASAPAEPAPPPGLTEAPRIPPEQSAAAGGFAACAQRYQERIQSITLGGAITPLLLEEWGETYEQAAALAAEGDPVAAEAACRALQREMDDILG